MLRFFKLIIENDVYNYTLSQANRLQLLWMLGGVVL